MGTPPRSEMSRTEMPSAVTRTAQPQRPAQPRSLALAGLCALVVTSHAIGGNVDFPRFPSISPDGSQLAFTWRGDIFIADIDLRAPSLPATRLTNHPLDEIRTVFLPDGSGIVFTGEQTGYTNLYAINTDGSGIRQITDTDRGFVPMQVSPDGRTVYGTSSREGDVYRPGVRPYAADIDSGLITRLHDAFGQNPHISPDGERTLFTRGGSSWNRRHYRGPDSRDVWMHNKADSTFVRITNWAGNDGLAKWRDTDTVLFLSDRELDTVNLYQADIDASGALDANSLRRLTSFDGQDVQWYDVSLDGRTAVLHVWDALYLLDLRRAAPPRKLSITAAEDLRDNVELEPVGGAVSDAALSPDGKVMAFVARGEVFVKNIDEDDAPTRRVTEALRGGHAHEQDLTWSPDGLRLYFVSDDDGTDSIYAATVSLTRSEIRERVNRALNIEDAEGATGDDHEEAKTQESGENVNTPDGITSYPHPAQGRWSGTITSPLTLPNGGNEADVVIVTTADAQGNLEVVFSVMGLDVTASSVRFADGDIELTLDFPGDTTITVTGTVTGGVVSGRWSGMEMDGTWSATRDESFPAPPGTADDDESGEDSGGNAAEGEETPEKPEDPRLDPTRWHDAVRFDIEPVVQTPAHDRDPRPLRDGMHLSFRRGLGDVVVRNLVTDEERTLVEGWDTGVEWRFSHDGRWFVYETSDLDFNSDIFVMPTDASAKPVNITMHPDNDAQPRLSADARILSFVSERRDEEYDVYAVYLDKRLESLAGPELEAYYEEAAKAAKKIKPIDPIDIDALRVAQAADGADGENDNDGKKKDDNDALRSPERLDLDDAYLRVRRLTSLGGSEFGLEMTPPGDRLIFTGTVNGTRALYSVDWKGGERKRLTTPAAVQHLSPSGSTVVFSRASGAGTVSPTGGSAKTHSIAFTVRIDRAEQATQKFVEMARVLGESFYHPTMKDLDWPALTERYLNLARQTRTADEFDHVGERFLGELNASHLGVTPPSPSSDLRQPAGRLGADLIAIPQDDGAVHYRVESLVPRGPQQNTEMQLAVGDTVTAIELEPITQRSGIDGALKGHVGRETIVTVRRTMPEDAEDAGQLVELDLLVTPISYGQEVGLRYAMWVERNRAEVERLSDGRLGYLHIRSMGQPSLDDFERDLFAAAYGRDALIVDVRNNGGGWTTDRLLSSIMVRPHSYTIPRGAEANGYRGYPQDRLFIQRYTKPMNLLVNEKSFSNAEIFAHAFKTLRRGTVIGQQTYGGVISTGGFRLIDGTFVRLPFRGWFLENDDADMENNGAMPDLVVVQTPEAESAGKDEQLEAAVRELTNRLDAAQDER